MFCRGGVYGVIPNNYKGKFNCSASLQRLEYLSFIHLNRIPQGKFKLLIAKAFNAEGVGTNSGVLSSIQDCAKMGANIISM